MSDRAGLSVALQGLQARWGRPAPVVGALATMPEEQDESWPVAAPRQSTQSADGRVVRTGFAALDALLGPGGIPRLATAAFRGDHSSGKTTLALRLAAQAQADGGIVAYLDLARSLDPVEAVARGIRLEWLVVLVPDSLAEGLAMAGHLLQGRSVDLLVIDLPGRVVDSPRRRGAHEPARGPVLETAHSTDRSQPRTSRQPSKGASPPEQIRRLAVLARRAGALLVLLEPPGLPESLQVALTEATALRLELGRRSWIRLGREVVGQRVEVAIARNRFGPTGRRTELRILYAEGGERDRCLGRAELLAESEVSGRSILAIPLSTVSGTADHAHPASLLASSSAPAGPRTLGTRAPSLISAGALPERTAHPGRATLGGRGRP